MAELKEPKTHLTAQTLQAEFPNIPDYEAEDLASMAEEPYAADSVLRILRQCGHSPDEDTARLLIHQIDSNDYTPLEEQPQESGVPPFSWNSDSGFDPTREKAVTLACQALTNTSLRVLEEQLEQMDPWITTVNEMQLPIHAETWQEAMELAQLWKTHITQRQFGPPTAALLNTGPGQLASWKNALGTHEIDPYTFAPIRTQQEFAAEAAAHQPHIYPQYLNRCIGDHAKPFLVMKRNKKKPRYICILRKIKGAWKLSYPNSFQTSHVSDKDMDIMSALAKKYRQIPAQPKEKRQQE